MKDNVDKRVVEFEFDNSKFDKNVKKSTKTLKNFDETLQFKDVSKSLDEIKIKFSALQVVFASVARNITDRVVNLGINLVKSLSIDNVAAGWQKFGEKTVAVGTLMSQTLKIAGKEIENYTEKFDIVNEQLDKLNWFTDETSYNFTDMVDNIGKFTAAGQDLDKSVEAMMGIANWAALSGQNAATASRSMYQLSQALGKGYVQLIDWKSIQNANMDTQEFRKTVLETAVSLGELTKEGENYISKTGKKFNINQFAEQLSSKWFTSDVLTATLKKYSSAVDKLYEITEKEGITASEAIELYGDQFEELGIKAFKAAQEARTFADAINSVKDAVSTGWMTTAEMIFGSYDEAKEFWTDLANELYDVFAESGNIRNSILEVWKSLEGRSDLFKRGGSDQGAFWNLYDSIIAVRDAISDAWDTIFPKSEFEDENDQIKDIGHNLKTITENIQRTTKRVKEFFETNTDLQRTLEGVFSIFKVLLSVAESLRYALDPLIFTLQQIGLYISDLFGDLGQQLASSSGYVSIITEMASAINEILTGAFSIIDIQKILSTITSILKSLVNVVKDLFSNLNNFLKDHDNITGMFSNIASGLNKLANGIKKFFNSFKKEKKTSGSSNTVADAVETATAGENGEKAEEETEEKVEKTIGWLEILTSLGKSLWSFAVSVYNLFKSILAASANFIQTLADLVNTISGYLFDLANKQENAINLLKRLLIIASAGFIIYEIAKVIVNVGWMLDYLKVNVYAFLDTASSALEKWSVSKIIRSIGEVLISLASAFLIITFALHLLKDVTWGAMAKAGIIFAVIIAFCILISKFSTKLLSETHILAKAENPMNKLSSLFSRKAESSTIGELAGVLIGLGIAFLFISKALKNFIAIKGQEAEFDKAFNRILTLIGVIAGLTVLLEIIQLVGKKLGKEADKASSILPSMFQIVGVALALRILLKTVVEITNIVVTFDEAAKNMLLDILLVVTALISIIIVINNATKKASNVTEKMRAVTINFGSRLGMTLLGIASVLLSITALVVVIAQLGSSATAGLIWVASILGSIFAAAIVLEILMLKETKKLQALNDAHKFFSVKDLKPNANPIAALLASIGFFLLSVTASLYLLQTMNIPWENFILVMGVILGFVSSIIFKLTLFSLAFRDKKNGLLKDKGSSSIISTSDSIAGIIKAIALLVLSIVAIATVASIFPEQSALLDLITKLEWFVFGVIGMLTIFSKANKNNKEEVTSNEKVSKLKQTFINILKIIPLLLVVGAAVTALYFLKDIKLESIIGGLSALSAFMIVFVMLTKSLNKTKQESNPGKALLSIIPSIVAIASIISAIYLLKDIDFDSVVNSLFAVSSFMIALLIFNSIINKVSNKSNGASGIVSMIPILLALAGVVASILLLKDITSPTILRITSALSVCLLAIIAAMFVISKIKTDSFTNVLKTLFNLVPVIVVIGILIGTILLLKDVNPDTMLKISAALSIGILGIVAAMFIISKTTVNFGQTLKFVANAAIFVVGIGLIAGGLLVFSQALKSLQINIKPDWELLGYISAVIGIILVIVTAFTLVKALIAGVALASISIIALAGAFALSMWLLSLGLNPLIPEMEKLDANAISLLKTLLLNLSLTGLTGILGIVGNSSLGVGMKVLGWGLSALTPGLKDLSEIQNPNTTMDTLKRLLLILSLTGLTGILGIAGNSSLGAGMKVLAEGMNALTPAISKFQQAQISGDTVTRFKNLLNILSGTGITGIFAKLGNSQIAEGMGDLSVGLLGDGGKNRGLLAAMKAMEDGDFSSQVKNFEKIMSIFKSGNIFTGVWETIKSLWGGDSGTQLQNGLYKFSLGLGYVVTELNKMNTNTSNAISGLGAIFNLAGKDYKVDKFKQIVSIINDIKFENGEEISEFSEILKTLMSQVDRINSLNAYQGGLKITPVLDLSKFNQGYSTLNNILGSLSGKTTGLSSSLALDISASRKANNDAGTNNNVNTYYNDTYNITMNVETNDPTELVDAVDKEIYTIKRDKRYASGFNKKLGGA